MCKKFPIFCPKKITGLDAHVEVSRHRSSGTLVTSEPYVPKKDIQGFLKMCGKEVRKRKGKKVHRNYSDYLIWVIIPWRGRGPNGDNNAWTAFSWVALTRVIESLDLQKPYSHLMSFCISWLHLVGWLRSPLAFLRHTTENGVDSQ